MKSLVNTEDDARKILYRKLVVLLLQQEMFVEQIQLPYITFYQLQEREYKHYWDFNVIVETTGGRIVGFGHVYKYLNKVRIQLYASNNYRGINKYYRGFSASILDLWEKIGDEWRIWKHKLKRVLK